MSEPSLTQTKFTPQARKRIQIGLLLIAALAFFIAFSFWSGVPAGDRTLPFWIGISVLLIILAIFGWVVWYLLFSPLPAEQIVRTQPIRAAYRKALAVLLVVGYFGISVGAFWDEIWHRQFGIPFGKDFFWRPHLLIYFGIVVTILLAFTGFIFLIRQRQGTIRMRFRSNPEIGLLVSLGGFLMYVLPADPIWHSIYGEDISAWSIPHMLLLLCFGSILLLATAIYMTTQRRREWVSPRKLRFTDALPLWMFAGISLSWYQFFTTEWDGGARFGQARPEWLLPLLITGGAVFIGVMANHTMRMSFAATLSGVLALALRFAYIQLFHAGSMMRVNAWVLALQVMVLIDLWYTFRPGRWIGAGVAAAIAMGAELLMFFNWYYPNNPILNLPTASAVLLVGSLGLSWLGGVVGNYLAKGSQEVNETAGSWRLSLGTFSLVAAFVAFVVFFVITATPPR